MKTVARHLLVSVLALLLPSALFAQTSEPEIEVRRLSEKGYPPIAEDEPSVMSPNEFYGMRSKVFSTEEIAVLRIAFKGKWYRSADYLAKEKAASLGANGLVLVESIGSEDLGAGAVRTYRLFRLTNSSGRPIYTKPAEDAAPAKPPESPVAGPVEASKPAETASVAPPVPRRKHRHFDWVWAEDISLLGHRLGFDVSRASKDELEQLRLYVRENFPGAQSRRLSKAYEKRSKITLDFVKRTVE